MTITLTYFPGRISNVTGGQEWTGEWDELEGYLRSHTVDAPTKDNSGYFVAAACKNGVRNNAAAQPTRVIALDWDVDGYVPDWAALAEYDYVAHTTGSHLKVCAANPNGHPRWRVWLPVVEASVEVVGSAQPPWPGAALRAISQPAYVPTTGDRTEWRTNPDPGWDPVDLGQWATRPATPAEPFVPPASRTAPSQASVNALVTRWLATPEGTNRLAGTTGACLAAWGWDDASIVGFLETWVHADPKLAKHIDDAVRGAAKRRAGDRIMGFPEMTELLGGVEFAAEAAREDVASVILAAPAEGFHEGPAPDSADPFGALISASDIAAWDAPPVRWLVEALALAPGAPALITGYGGSGKTTFVQHLAITVATAGQRLLGAYPVRHGSVLHIDHEQGADLSKRRYQRLGITGAAQLDLVAFPRWSLADPDPVARAYFERACRGRALVIVDSLIASCAAFLEDENSSATREPLDFLGQVSDRTGAVVLVIHHSKKDRTVKRTSARGSGAITDGVSMHITYEKEDDDDRLSPPVLSLMKVRHEDPPGILTSNIAVAKVDRVDGAVGSYTLAVVDAEARASAQSAASADCHDKTVQLFMSGWVGPARDAALQIGLRKQDVLVVVKQLAQDGIITRVRAGYKLSEPNN